jgi:Rieske Fe-S protein
MNTPAPDEPEKCACEGKDNKASRRDFLLKVGFGLNAIAAAAIGIPIVGYALSSFVQKFPLKRISLGPVSNFPEGTTRIASYKNPYSRNWDGDTAEIPCWVRHISGNEFQVFAINCTHLGCPVRWFDESKLFMCPCHGGVFYQDGTHASGPPPRPLYTYENLVENGELFVMGGILPTLANPKV